MNQVNFSSQSLYAETHRPNQAYSGIESPPPHTHTHVHTKNNDTGALQKGDSVYISEEARLAQSVNNFQPNPEDNTCSSNKQNVASISDEAGAETFKNNNGIDELDFTTVKTIEKDDGTKIEIRYAIDKDNKTVAKANFSYSNGTNQSIIINETSIISKNDNIWTLKHQNISNPEKIEYAKLNIQDDSGKRTEYMYKDEVRINGNDSDDIIILLPEESENGIIFNVNSGEGNDFVIDLSGGISNIKTGGGNDAIIGFSGADARGGKYSVDSGSGDDIIELAGSSAYISSGDGNDTISVNTVFANKIDAGSGNDIIDVSADNAQEIIGGEGNDKINVHGNISSVKIYGDTKDNPDVVGDSISISGNLINGNIYTGDGSNNITIGAAFNTTINTGSGNDIVKIGAMHDSYLYTGDGDDNISINFSSGGKIISGAGSNIIDIINAFGSEIYSSEIEKKQKNTYKNNKTSNNTGQAELSEYDKQIAEAAIGGDDSNAKEIPSEEIESG